MASEHDKDVWRWDGLLAGDAITLWAASDVFEAVAAGEAVEITSAAAGALFFGTMAACVYPVILGGLAVAVFSQDEAFSKQWAEGAGAIGLGVSFGSLSATVAGSLYQALFVPGGDPTDVTKAGGAIGSVGDALAAIAGAGKPADYAFAAANYVATLPGTYLDYFDSPTSTTGGDGAQGKPTSPGGPSGAGGAGAPDNPWPELLYPFSPGMGDLPPLSGGDGDASPYGPPDGTLVFSMQPGGSWNSPESSGDSGVYSNSTGQYGGSGTGGSTPTDCNTDCAPQECADCTHECADCTHDCSDCTHQCSDCSDCSDCECI